MARVAAAAARRTFGDEGAVAGELFSDTEPTAFVSSMSTTQSPARFTDTMSELRARNVGR